MAVSGGSCVLSCIRAPLPFCLQLDDVLLHVDPADPDTITVKLLCGWAAGEDGLFSPSNVRTSGGLPEYKAPEVRRHIPTLFQWS